MDKLTEQQRIVFFAKVLSQALLEVREESYEAELPKSFYLTDLIHNLPSHLLQVYLRPEEVSLNDVLATFEKRLDNEKVKAWVDNIRNSLDFDSSFE